MASLATIRRTLVNVGKSLYLRGMLAGTDGNISARMPDGRIVITPSGLPKGRLSPDDLTVLGPSGVHLEGRLPASSEVAMHMFVYTSRPEINACVHTHAPYSTSFAVAGIELTEDVMPEVVLMVGKIPLTDYAPPGTKAVPESLAPFVATSDAFLLRNHGLLTIGRSVEEAFCRHEVVEHYARIMHLAHQLGGTAKIPADDLERLKKLRQEHLSAKAIRN